MNPSPELNVLIRAARKAGVLALRHFDRLDRLEIHMKQRNDPVSSADIEVEREIIYHLRKAYPDYDLLAEETPVERSPGKRCWIVDPIDGTANFIRGISHFAISIALASEKGEVVAGVVYAPVVDELFIAERGRGAFLNNHRIRVSRQHTLKQGLLATGFPFKAQKYLDFYLKSFRALFLESGDIRHMGCAALDLSYTAAGRFEGFWEMQLAPWDMAAGSLILQEAGGFVTDFSGSEHFMESGHIVGANPVLHQRMLKILHACDFEAI